jgi:hypothetical protein
VGVPAVSVASDAPEPESLGMTAGGLRDRTEVLWCANQRHRRGNGWSFPPNVERLLRELTKGKRVGQLFGGLARWGVKLDLDPVTKPHVRGDAWLPPFRKDAFDVVILDPPYVAVNQQMKQQLLRSAAYIAREHVIWFHTQWIAGDARMRIERAWLVRVGDSCSVRCIEVFRVPEHKQRPRLYFTRGPALKYNRWLDGAQRLPFPTEASA